MKLLIQNLMAIVWGAIFGLVLAYIGGQLESASANFPMAAILGAIVAFVFTNGITWMTSHADPSKPRN